MLSADLRLPSDLAAKVEAAVQRILEIAQPQQVILFGSYAEGCAGEDSDLDLPVVAETPSAVRLAAELHEALEPLLAPWSFDLLVCTPESWETGRRVRGFVTREALPQGSAPLCRLKRETLCSRPSCGWSTPEATESQ